MKRRYDDDYYDARMIQDSRNGTFGVEKGMEMREFRLFYFLHARTTHTSSVHTPKEDKRTHTDDDVDAFSSPEYARISHFPLLPSRVCP